MHNLTVKIENNKQLLDIPIRLVAFSLTQDDTKCRTCLSALINSYNRIDNILSAFAIFGRSSILRAHLLSLLYLCKAIIVAIVGVVSVVE